MLYSKSFMFVIFSSLKRILRNISFNVISLFDKESVSIIELIKEGSCFDVSGKSLLNMFISDSFLEISLYDNLMCSLKILSLR